jgi:carbonic anhydrase
MINNKINPSDTCFEAIDVRKKVWTLCSQTIQEKKKWLCSLEKYFKENMDSFCGVNNEEKKLQANSTAMFSDKLMNNTKKMFIIPRESNKCNEEWNYEQNGTDWECTCSEGLNQSPVNLPSPSVAEASHIKPLFIYDVIEPVTKESSVDGILRENETLKIFNKEGMLRIVSSKFGRIVLADGGVFNAEEIVFHTPAEHMINGKRFDMEIQIIHYGVSKGDIAKQVVLSFLFYMKPGVFNDFLDKIDVYNLPNEIDKFKDLYSTLNIPSIFYSSVYRNPYYDTDKIPMKDFSFYSYDGSLTFPPCTERTTVIVAGEPLPISHTFVELFKEALRKPEFFGVDGKLHQGDEKPKLNSRNVQPLNGRKISFYQSQIHGLD